MARLTKQAAAQKIGDLLDETADSITRNASVFGINPDIAQKFAYQCDLIADHIAKKAGLNLTKLAAQRKQALSGDDVFNEGTLGFDPENIGEEVAGPSEQDADEDYMNDHFTQQWNRELREKQEAGEVSNGQGSPEVQAPQPGIQASLQLGTKLAGLYGDLNAASSRCASSSDAGVKLLGTRLASASASVLQFQARMLDGTETQDRAAFVLQAASHVRPHLAGEVAPASAEKLARMISILAGFTKAA